MKKKEILIPGVCYLFAALTFAFFAPTEVILLNRGDFHYTFESFWWFQLLLTLGLAGLATLITMLLPRKARTVLTALALGTGTAAWVQMMFMNGKMGRLGMEETAVSTAETVINLVIWVGIAAAILIAALVLEKKGKKIGTWMGAIAGVLTAVQLVAFVSLLFTSSAAVGEKGHRFTKQGEFELSKGTNAVVFLMDAADGTMVHQMMEAYPEMNEQLSGWVWYPNAVSEYSRTYPGLTYLLTGERTYPDHPQNECVDTAFDQSDFLRTMHDAGTDITVYTMDGSYISTNADGIIRNIRKNENLFSDLNLPGLEKGLARISLFKCLPYAFKNMVSYDVAVLNQTTFKDRDYTWKDPYVFNDFYEKDVFKTTDRYQKAFRFYHLWSAHGFSEWDENLKIIKIQDEVDPYLRLKGSFKLLEAYCDEMKKAGVYDDALIIAVADHGVSRGDDEKLIQDKAACPLLMVKYPRSKETGKIEISRAPVCHEDLFATITDALGVQRTKAGSGRSIQEIAEEESRERLYYYLALGKESEVVLLREYAIQGDAEDINNWKETGNVWDAKYGW